MIQTNIWNKNAYTWIIDVGKASKARWNSLKWVFIVKEDHLVGQQSGCGGCVVQFRLHQHTEGFWDDEGGVWRQNNKICVKYVSEAENVLLLSRKSSMICFCVLGCCIVTIVRLIPVPSLELQYIRTMPCLHINGCYKKKMVIL